MRALFLILMSLLCRATFGQDENRFKNFHGINNPHNNVDFFEAEGYDIFVQHVENGLDEKGISRIKKKYSIKDEHLTLDSILKVKVLNRSEEQNGITGHYTYYLLPVAGKKSIVVGFVRAKSRDIGLERDFVNSYLSNRIPMSVYTELDIESIDFAGRTITVGPACRWMSPHNVQCPDRGQMNWAIFDDLGKAELYRDTHFEITKNKNLVNLKEEGWITVKFEGIETRALRTKIKIQLPKLVMGGSNILIVYYVTAQVRGKYVSCVLSHYTDDIGAKRLPPLLSEVMELVE